MSIIIKRPTESELHLGAQVGVLRQIFAMRSNLHNAHRLQYCGFANHIDGALGEMMLAQHVGLFWSGTVGTVKAPADVGRCYQVRATDHPQGKLIVYREDNDNQPYVLARVLLPEVHLVGWLWGAEAKSAKHWRTDVRSPAFFAWPLRDMSELPDEPTILARLQTQSVA